MGTRGDKSWGAADAGQGNRRELLRSVARYAALGGITALSAGLILKDRTATSGQQCRRSRTGQVELSEPSSLCRDCAVVAQCTLPQAATARKSSKG
jgi:hypothetical protein